jgi:hypothetical protein
MTASVTEFDSPWKDILEAYFEDFILFFFPEVHALTDWQAGYEFLDKELQQITQDAGQGRRVLDKLVKVRRKDGGELHLYIHTEIQSQYDSGFTRRMFTYYHRLLDKYSQGVVSLAILGDNRKKWRPDKFSSELAGCKLTFQFPIAKLTDWRDKWEALEQTRNPFGIIVRIHLKALETRRSPANRLEWKFRLFKALYEEGYGREDIIRLFHFLDWVMSLPDKAERQFDKLVFQFEEEKKMPYITSIERHGIEKGIAEGLQQGLQKGLQQGHEAGFEEGRGQGLEQALIMVLTNRFGRLSPHLVEMVEAIGDPILLSELLKEALGVKSLPAFERRIAESGRVRH